MVLISVRCPHCAQSNVVKRGQTANDKQRYLCRSTDCSAQTFILEYEDRGRIPEVKSQIIDMTLNGSGIRDIARVLRISSSTVMNELKKRIVAELRSS
jgi:transposase-like protein